MSRNVARRRWLTGLAALLLPMLLAAPVVWILNRQAADLRGEERQLRNEILRLDRALVEIEALDRVRATILARKSIVETLDERRSRAVRLLNALGALPGGVQLGTVTARGDSVTLTGVAVVPIEGAVMALATAGLDDVRVERAASVPPGVSVPFEIRASVPGTLRADAGPPSP